MNESENDSDEMRNTALRKRLPSSARRGGLLNTLPICGKATSARQADRLSSHCCQRALLAITVYRHTLQNTHSLEAAAAIC